MSSWTLLFLISTLLLSTLAQNTTTDFKNLGTPLPPALGGVFTSVNSPARGARFDNKTVFCNVTYAGGLVEANITNQFDFPTAGKTAVTLNGTCLIINSTFDVADGFGKANGETLEFGLVGSISTVACGLQQQVNMCWGVIGGVFVDADLKPAPLCIHYTRVSAQGGHPPFMNFGVFPGEYTADFSQVACSQTPSRSDLLFGTENLYCSGTAEQRYNCINTPASRCIQSGKTISDIGIGMSVGGIGLLLVTLVFILVIQHFAPK